MTSIDCPCCGGAGKIDDASGVPLTSVEREIFDAVFAAKTSGISLDGLVNRIYGGRADGGPDDAKGVTRVRICRMNKELAKVGLRVKATNLGPGAVYRVVAAAPTA